MERLLFRMGEDWLRSLLVTRTFIEWANINKYWHPEHNGYILLVSLFGIIKLSIEHL